jgi:crossover junction endodeoxyribonuclease RuvC
MNAVPIILGIDPGLTGGLAFYAPSNPRAVAALDIPLAGGEVDVDAFTALIRQHDPDLGVIERAAAMPGQGVVSTFKFGAAYGALRAAVAASGVPLHVVAPGVWKRHFRLSADKEQARALAIRLWPGVGHFSRKKDHGRAEAALLARYGAEVVLSHSRMELAA